MPGFAEERKRNASGREIERVVVASSGEGKKRKRKAPAAEVEQQVAEVAGLIRGAHGESFEELGRRMLEWAKENGVV